MLSFGVCLGWRVLELVGVRRSTLRDGGSLSRLRAALRRFFLLTRFFRRTHGTCTHRGKFSAPFTITLNGNVAPLASPTMGN